MSVATESSKRSGELSAVRQPSLRTWQMVILVLIPLAIRLSLLLVVGDDVTRLHTPDSPAYVELGHNFSAYWHPNSPLFEQSLNRTPGYPAMIAAIFAVFGDSIQAIVILQILVSVVGVVICYQIGRRLIGTTAGFLAALLFAVDPVSSLWAVHVQNETLFTFLLLLFMLLWLRSIRLQDAVATGAAGLLLGLATLVRPAGLYLPFLLLPAYLFVSAPWKQRWYSSVLLVGGALLPVLLWMGHNYRQAGIAELSVIEGKELLYCRAAGAVAESDGTTRWDAATELAATLWGEYGISLSDAERAEVTSHMLGNWAGLNQCFDRLASESGASISSRTIASEEKRMALRVLANHPLGAVTTAGKGAVRLLIGPGAGTMTDLFVLDPDGPQHRWLRRLFVALSVFFLGMLYAGAGIAVVALWKSGKFFTLYFLVAIGAYFVLVSLGPTAYSRYRVPMMPCLCLLAGYGIVHFLRRMKWLVLGHQGAAVVH